MDADFKNFEFSKGLTKISSIMVAIGIIAVAVSFSLNKTVAWVDFLVNTLYFVTVSVSGVFFLSLAGILQASWITPYKRVVEVITKFLPYGFVLMLCMYFGLHTVYEWTHTELVMSDPILSQKTAWLNETGFMLRMAIIFIVWIGLAKLHLKYSQAQDANKGESYTHRIKRLSAIGLILFGLSISVAGFDWIMSVEPHWFSTIFGVYIFAGSFVSGMAIITLATIKLKEWGYLDKYITDDHLHDLGKWMFGFSVFWAYIWVSQYLLIWYANIPEETDYYVSRMVDWNTFFFLNLFVNWFLPFVLLMKRGAKRSAKRLKLVACILLVGHFMDLYLMVAPKVFHHNDIHHVTGYGLLQLAQWIGFFGLFIFVVGKALTKTDIIAHGDPNLDEGLHLHQ